MSRRVLVTGAGGFIGHHLVTRLKADGCWVRGVDLKAPEYADSPADDFRLVDLRRWEDCVSATEGVDEVYALAADMGGMGFISENDASILFGNTMIDFQTLEASRRNGVARHLYASTACVYPEYLQEEADVAPLKESQVFPAQPQDAYGWEKLNTEQLYQRYRDDYDLDVRIARFHNIFGPLGTWDGGREKVPAALCRKVATAKLTGDPVIEIWGDGEQTRSFCYVDDCVDALVLLMASGYRSPVNVGADRMVTINELADVVAAAAGVRIEKKHVEGPMGVRGRNSDNDLVRSVLGWEPRVSLEEGIARTYAWVEEQVRARAAA